MDVKAIYGSLTKWLDNGRNYVFGRPWGVVTIVLQFGTFFAVKGQDISIEDIGFFSAILAIALLGLGWFYSKFGLLAAETSARQQENPQQMETLKRLKRIEEMLTRMEAMK